MIIELLSPTTEHEDRTTKFTIYEQMLRVPEYFLYDRDTERLEGLRLVGAVTHPDRTIVVGCGARNSVCGWERGLGNIRACTPTWLRMYTPDGALVPTHGEACNRRRIREQQRADQEKACWCY